MSTEPSKVVREISDEELLQRAFELLQWDEAVPPSIRLHVNKGWLTLEGTVSWPFQRYNADEDLRHLPGVVGISNNIRIKPKAKGMPWLFNSRLPTQRRA